MFKDDSGGTIVLICIFGNIHSGKSKLINQLLHRKPEYGYISIDEERKNISNGSFLGESKALQGFLNKVAKSSNAFIECCGVGTTAKELGALLRNKKLEFKIFVVQSLADVCMERLALSKIDSTPYPYKKRPMSETVFLIDGLIKEKEIEKIFNLENGEIGYIENADEVAITTILQHCK